MDIDRLFVNKQFALWAVVFTTLFVVTVSVLKAVGAPVIVAVVAGIALNEVTEPVMDWLIDWRDTSEEIENVRP